MKLIRLLSFSLLAFVASCSPSATLKPSQSLSLRCEAEVPPEHNKRLFETPPNGQPEPVRYKVSYEAFWWNAVCVKASDLNARVPFACSGTPAACAGGSDGASDAVDSISSLLKQYSQEAVVTYLTTLAESPVAKEKMKPYFTSPKSDAHGF